jgi:putative endonuclease
MFTVYALYSKGYNKIYIGFTSNLQQRLLSHNESGKKGFTIKYRPWQLIYKEAFEHKPDALKREKQLKTAAGRNFIWSVIHAM